MRHWGILRWTCLAAGILCAAGYALLAIGAAPEALRFAAAVSALLWLAVAYLASDELLAKVARALWGSG
jgi:hypothetical protein